MGERVRRWVPLSVVTGMGHRSSCQRAAPGPRVQSQVLAQNVAAGRFLLRPGQTHLGTEGCVCGKPVLL